MGTDAPTPFPTGLVANKAHLYLSNPGPDPNPDPDPDPNPNQAHLYLSYGVADADWRTAQLDPLSQP